MEQDLTEIVKQEADDIRTYIGPMGGVRYDAGAPRPYWMRVLAELKARAASEQDKK